MDIFWSNFEMLTLFKLWTTDKSSIFLEIPTARYLLSYWSISKFALQTHCFFCFFYSSTYYLYLRTFRKKNVTFPFVPSKFLYIFILSRLQQNFFKKLSFTLKSIRILLITKISINFRKNYLSLHFYKLYKFMKIC